MPTPQLADSDKAKLKAALAKMEADGVSEAEMDAVAQDFIARKSVKQDTTSKTAPVVDNNQQSPAAAPQPEVNAAPPQPEQPFDPLAASRTREEKKRLITASDEYYQTLAGQGAGLVPIDKSVNEKHKAGLAEIDKQFEAAGIDKEVSKDLAGLPEGEGFFLGSSVPVLLQNRKSNPQLYQTQLGAMKYKGGLFNHVRDLEGLEVAKQVNKEISDLELTDYRAATKAAMGAAQAFVENSDEKNEIIRNIKAAKAFDYGSQPIQPDPRFGNVNEYQLRALNFIEDTDPEAFKSYLRLMNPDPAKTLPGTDARLGLEIKAKELEMKGLDLRAKALDQKLTDLKNRGQEGSSEYQELAAQWEALSENVKTMPQRYPQAHKLDLEQVVQEVYGANKSAGGQLVWEFGDNAKDTFGWMWDIIKSPFSSEGDKVIEDLELLGDKSWKESYATYDPENIRQVGSQMVRQFGNDLQKQLDEIDANPDLNDEEKRFYGERAIAKNFDQVGWKANDKAGKINFTGKAVLNSSVDVLGTLLPQAAISVLTGGAGNASKARQIVSLAAGTWATASNDNRRDALEKNVSNPTLYTVGHTTVDFLTEMVSPDWKVLKKLYGAGDNILAKIVNHADFEKWVKEAKPGKWGALKAAIGQTLKVGTENTLKEGAEEFLGAVGGNVFDNKVMNIETGVMDGARDAFIQTVMGMGPLGLLGLPGNLAKVTRLQKYAFYEVGMDPDRFKKGVQAEVEAGVITETEAKDKVEDIDRASRAVKSSLAVKLDGTPMTDNEKVQYAFNQEVITEINELIKNVPEESKKELTTQLEEIQKEQAELLKPRPAEEKAKEEEVKPAGPVQETVPTTTIEQPAPQEPAVAEISSPSKTTANERKEERRQEELLTPDSVQQPLPTKETLSEEGAGTPGAVATETATVEVKGKKKLKQDVTPRNLVKRLDGEELDAYDEVMRYFANDGKVGYGALQEIFGGPSNATEDGRKSIEKEKRSRIGMLSKTGPQTVDQLANYLWKNQGEYSNNTTIDYFNAINEILPTINSRDQAVNNLVEKFKLREIEDNVSEEDVQAIASMGEIRGPFSEGWTKEEQAAWEKEGKSAAVAAQVAEVEKVAEELTTDDEEAMFEIIRAHQDENGEVDWDELESKTNGFDPDILNLPINVQNKLDELIKQKQTAQGKVAEGPGKSGDTATKVSGSTDQKGTRQDGKDAKQKKVDKGGVDTLRAEQAVEKKPQVGHEKTYKKNLETSKKVFAFLYPKANLVEVQGHKEYTDIRYDAYIKSDADMDLSPAEREQRGRDIANGSLGFYSNDGNIYINKELILANRNAEHTVVHEVIHPLLWELNKGQEGLGVTDPGLIGKWYNIIRMELADEIGMERVWLHMNAYPGFGSDNEALNRAFATPIQRVEAVTEFVALAVTGQIDVSKLSKSTATKFFDLLNKIFEAIGIKYRIRTADDLQTLIAALKPAFGDGAVEAIQKAMAARSPEWVGVAADMLSSYQQGSNAPSRDAIKQLIKKWPKAGSRKKLIAAVSKITGLDLVESEALVDEVHGLPPTPPRPPASTLASDQEGSYKKIVAALSPLEKEKPGWFPRMLTALSNLSAWGDNPYRFVSLIPEKIAKEYGVKNPLKIPLGRIFERNSAGRGFLKVDSFLRDVIGTGKDRMKGQELKDFEVYIASKRIIDRYETMDRLRAAGEDVDRSTGNITYNNAVEALGYLESRYGQQGVSKFEGRAQAMQVHANNMLLTLVDSGFLSKEQYDKIKAENDFYAPFNVVQEKLLAEMPDAPVGVSGVVKRIKGIKADVPYNTGIEDLDDLSKALREKKITADEYFNTATKIIEAEWQSGNISETQRDEYIMQLENPGFTMNSILDAMANMIYKAEGIALKNVVMNRLHSLTEIDKEQIYIKNIPASDAFTVMTMGNGDTRQVLKQLGAIPVPEGFAPVRYKVNGKDVVAAINKRAADKLNSVNVDDSTMIDHFINFFNSAFRTAVITLSGAFIVKNLLIDTIRTAMLSRYGLFAGKGLVAPIVNAVLFAPQYIEAFITSLRGNTIGFNRPDAYKAWMNSDSFSKGMFDDLFNQQKKIKSIHQSKAKGILQKAAALIDWPGVVTEQTHKILAFQRGQSVEGLQSQMVTTQLASWISHSFNPNMTKEETVEALDKLNYEVQNMAGSPNFPATHKGLKRLSMFLQFFSAAFKGEMSDYRRVANLFSTKGEGVKLSAQERIQMLASFGTVTAAIAYYAIQNIADDDDEKEFNTMSSFYRDNYINIPVGTFDFTDKDGNVTEHTDYLRIPLRGLTSTINVIALNYIRYMKTADPEALSTAAYQIAGNTSPLKLHGDDGAEYIESVVTNFTPLFKFPTEHAFNRDTHHHIDLIPSGFDNGMLEKYKRGDLDPWEVKNWKTSEGAIEWSQFIFETTGVRVTPITLEHMERTMGRPSKLVQKATQNPFLRSLDDYPVYTPKEKKK